MENHYESLSTSKWSTRGWTYQEQILCRRAVFFLDTMIFWDCQCSIWDEIELKPSRYETKSPHSVMGRRLASLRRPDFSIYVDLVCPYNERNFSYPQDALLAFTGILNTLYSTFPGGFVCGLPRMFIDHALIWQPFGRATRRLDRSDNVRHAAPPRTSSLPSWSWCGWQCLVDPHSLRSGLLDIDGNYQRKASSWRTQSLVQWHTLDTNGHSAPISASSSSGPVIDNDPLLTCVTTKACFRPGALLAPAASAAYEAYMKLSAFEHPKFIQGPNEHDVLPVLVLRDAQNEPAGLLRLAGSSPIDFDGEVELIAISTRSAKLSDLDSCFEEQAYHRESVVWDNQLNFV
ncbi:hypothetical protein AAE478_009728 [Parahypoxylon ruwenzoriense]